MNVDLAFSQGQYGVLASVGFTLLFATASLFAGGFVDRNDRRLVGVASCAVWSVATLATGLAGSYPQVLGARVMTGLACAFTTPAAYTWISDKFSPSRQSLANSLYSSAVYLGGGLASLSLLLNSSVGWRSSYLVVGAFGLIAALVAWFVVEPDDPGRGAVVESTAASAEPTTKKMGGDSILPLLRSPLPGTIFLASFLRFCAGLTIGIWGATYFKDAFPDSASSYAVVNALIVSICGGVSGIGGGVVADELSKRGYSRLLVPVAGR